MHFSQMSASVPPVQGDGWSAPVAAAVLCTLLAYLIPVKVGQAYRSDEWPYILKEPPVFTPTEQPEWEDISLASDSPTSPPELLTEHVPGGNAGDALLDLGRAGPSVVCGGCSFHLHADVFSYYFKPGEEAAEWFHPRCVFDAIANMPVSVHEACLERALSLSVSVDLPPSAQGLLDDLVSALCDLTDVAATQLAHVNDYYKRQRAWEDLRDWANDNTQKRQRVSLLPVDETQPDSFPATLADHVIVLESQQCSMPDAQPR